MKKTLFLIALNALFVLSASSQNWTTGTGKLYTNPGTTKVGIGTTNPTARLTVSGDALLSLPGSGETIQGLTVNIASFNTVANSKRSYFLKLNDVGSSEGAFIVRGDGYVGIGTFNPGVKLDVVGTIRAHEVKVCLNQGCDYVFEPNYKLMPIKELGNFVNENRHLPEVAPAAEMENEGINLSEMNAMLLKKVEELTLYIVELNDRIEKLETKNN